ncbi:MAG: FtsQ-type POTRA domain-containing protein [Francisellaceae bacterium]|nr:FtsQ-type POTRA domain-containing protein [Francisellaceae bacterium]
MQDAKKYRLTIILVVAGLLVGSAALYSGIFFAKQQWLISNVTFKNKLNYVDISELEPQLADYLGKSFLFTDLSDLHKKLLTNEWVKEVEISRNWPDTLEIKFQEEIPLAYLNQSRLVTTEGKVINSRPQVTIKLPIFEVENSYLDDAFIYYFDILSKIGPLGLGIEKLSHTAVDGWKLTLDRGFELILGHNEIMVRLTRFVLAYQRKLESLSDNFDYVDLRYTNGVAIGWKTTNN